MSKLCQVEKAITAEGFSAFGSVSDVEPRLWEIQILVRNSCLWSPFAYSAKHFAAITALIETDGLPAVQRYNGAQVPTASNVVHVGPRGQRLTLFARAVNVSLFVAADALFNPGVTIATTPPMTLVLKIAPALQVQPYGQQVSMVPACAYLNRAGAEPILGPAGIIPGYRQLPMFSSEMRVAGVAADSFLAFLDASLDNAGSPNVLVDPMFGTSWMTLAGHYFNWGPIPTYAAGVYVRSGVVLSR